MALLVVLTHGALLRPHHHRQPFTSRTFSAAPVLTAAVDDNGETALILAAEAGAEEQVQSLLASGADATIASFSGWTALHGAAECGSVGIITALAVAGADVSAAASSGKTPLDIARQYKQPAAASVLTGLGATANVSKPPSEQACSPRAAPPVMMTAGKGGKGKGKEKEPRENGLERLYLKAAPFIYYGTYCAFFGKMVLVLVERGLPGANV